jgi:cyanate permease
VGHLCVCFSGTLIRLLTAIIVLPLFYIQVFSQSRGLSETLSFYSLSIINAASVFGRTLPNLIADKLGVFNMLIMASLCSGIVMFGWLPAHGEAGIIVFSLLFGFFSGAYVSILPGCFASLRYELPSRMI